MTGCGESSPGFHPSARLATTTSGALASLYLRAIREQWRQRMGVGAWRDFHDYVVARLPYISPSPGAETVLMGQRARADADWAEKLAAKKRERLQVEGEGVASSARAGRGECMEAAESSRRNWCADKGGWRRRRRR